MVEYAQDTIKRAPCLVLMGREPLSATPPWRLGLAEAGSR
jgi:hypothetical protein